MKKNERQRRYHFHPNAKSDFVKVPAKCHEKLTMSTFNYGNLMKSEIKQFQTRLYLFVKVIWSLQIE